MKLTSPLIGQKVKLRMFSEMDITKRYLAWLNEKSTMRYSRQSEKLHSRVSALGYLKSFNRTDNLFIAIDDVSVDKMVGTMTVYIEMNHGTADVGILIGERDLWGKGFGFDAWSTMMEYLTQSSSIRKITGGAMSLNLGMIKIMERGGMRLEAVRKAQRIFEGKAVDVVLYAKFV